MPKFNYRAKEGTDNVVSGSVEATTDADAINKIIRQGYTPISITKESSAVEPHLKTSVKVSLSDLTTFSRQLSALLESGLNLLRALMIVKTQTENPKFAALIDEISNSVREGHPLSSSLARYPKIFAGVYVAMVRAGEAGGMLSRILAQITTVLEKEDELRSKIAAALVYPVLLLTVGSISVFVLLTFVIPRIVRIFEEMGQALPLPTQILIGISDFFANWWFIVIIIAALVFFVVDRYYKTREGRLHIDKMKLKFPVIGKFINQVELVHFSRTLGSLLANGVPIIQASRSAAETMNNAVLKNELEEVNKQITKGSSLTKSLTASGFFPAFVNNMVSIGEESGSLDKSLLKVAEIYDKEIDRSIKVVTSLIEPILILFFGGVVAFIVVSMLLPILQISTIVK